MGQYDVLELLTDKWISVNELEKQVGTMYGPLCRCLNRLRKGNLVDYRLVKKKVNVHVCIFYEYRKRTKTHVNDDSRIVLNDSYDNI